METMIFQLIQTVGFPIAIAVYLLVRSQRKTDYFLANLDSTLDKIEKNLIILNLSIGKVLNGKSEEFARVFKEVLKNEELQANGVNGQKEQKTSEKDPKKG